jgi:Putative exonuclease SbcCD, C subunit
VVTLLQPLLATLVALYDESPTAPRPLWLDEAFEGVAPANRVTMLDLLAAARSSTSRTSFSGTVNTVPQRRPVESWVSSHIPPARPGASAGPGTAQT